MNTFYFNENNKNMSAEYGQVLMMSVCKSSEKVHVKKQPFVSTISGISLLTISDLFIKFHSIITIK